MTEIKTNIQSDLAGIGITTIALNKRVVDDIRFRPFIVGEDLVYSCECFSRANKIFVSNKVQYGYRTRKGSATKSSLSERKVRDYIRFTREMLEVLDRSGKKVGRAFSRTRGNLLIEGCPYMISKYFSDISKAELNTLWLENMEAVKSLRILSPWQRFVCYTVTMLNFRLLRFVLCELPHILKVKGIHFK